MPNIDSLCYCSIKRISFQKLLSEFTPPKNSNYLLPRIAFFGYFNNLSLSCQRHISKNLGFEFYSKIPFGTTNEKQMHVLSSKWTEITKNYTRLIVIGDSFNDDNETALFKSYKATKETPIVFQEKIAVIKESELVKLHPDYPVINNSTIWKDIPLI